MINAMPTGSTPAIKSSSERIPNQRPRKRDCNVLKFHNFVPNKELSCFSRIRGSNDNVLTGHCLKEENGSKQINVCNWQKKQQSTPSTSENNDKMDSHQQSIQLLSTKEEIPMVYNAISTTATINSDDLTSKSILGSLLARNEINRAVNISKQPNDDLINGYTVINVGENGANNNDSESLAINGNYSFLLPTTSTIKTTNKINRRKPSTVRRFLRSSESPSNDDEEDCDYDADESNHETKDNQDEPLDLSRARKRPLLTRKKGEMKMLKNDQFNQLIDYLPVLIPESQITSQRLPQTVITSFLPYLLPEQQQQSTMKSINSSSTTGIDPMTLLKQNKLLLPHLPNGHQHQHQHQHHIPMIPSSSDSIPTNSSISPSSSTSSSSSSSNTSIVSPLNHYLHSSRGSTSTIPGVKHFKVYNNNNNQTKSSSSSGNHHHHRHYDHLHHQYQNVNRNSNQNGPVNERNTIKAKLENEFRTNGFLVKTKEVSDGEATFCKFRQLRKYTRYYLKSWHQHLPDEINKLWKGFLPPKTSKPSSSSSTTTINTNSPLDQTGTTIAPSLNKRMTLNGQPMDISTAYQSFS